MPSPSLISLCKTFLQPYWLIYIDIESVGVGEVVGVAVSLDLTAERLQDAETLGG
jgi:hypothetical protein